MDHYLKFPTETEYTSIVFDNSGLSIDSIGEIPDVAGYHVNIRGELTEDMQAQLALFLIDPPITPYRIWM